MFSIEKNKKGEIALLCGYTQHYRRPFEGFIFHHIGYGRRCIQFNTRVCRSSGALCLAPTATNATVEPIRKPPDGTVHFTNSKFSIGATDDVDQGSADG